MNWTDALKFCWPSPWWRKAKESKRRRAGERRGAFLQCLAWESIRDRFLWRASLCVCIYVCVCLSWAMIEEEREDVPIDKEGLADTSNTYGRGGERESAGETRMNVDAFPLSPGVSLSPLPITTHVPLSFYIILPLRALLLFSYFFFGYFFCVVSSALLFVLPARVWKTDEKWVGESGRWERSALTQAKQRAPPPPACVCVCTSL